MSKPTSRSPAIPWIGGTLLWAYMSVLAHTMRWRTEGLDYLQKPWEEHTPFILATWHSRILLMSYPQIINRPKWKKRPTPMTLMVSASKDGEFTNRSSQWLGLGVIRGSAPTKSKGKTQGKRGVDAAREALRLLSRGGGLVVTIDGPRGPPEEVGIGAVKLAQQVGAPIVVYGLSADAKRLDSWDRLLFPAPFARGAIVVAKPIPTSKDMDSEELRLRVERELKIVTARADELAGLKDRRNTPLPAAPTPPQPAIMENTALPERTGS